MFWCSYVREFNTDTASFWKKIGYFGVGIFGFLFSDSWVSENVEGSMVWFWRTASTFEKYNQGLKLWGWKTKGKWGVCRDTDGCVCSSQGGHHAHHADPGFGSILSEWTWVRTWVRVLWVISNVDISLKAQRDPHSSSSILVRLATIMILFIMRCAVYGT